MQIDYKPTFIRAYNKLPPELQLEVKEKLQLFKDSSNHERLRVHKLHGLLKQFYSFSLTYAHRAVFYYETKQNVIMVDLGDHDVYREEEKSL